MRGGEGEPVVPPAEEVSTWDKFTNVFSNTESKFNEGANMLEGKLNEGVNAIKDNSTNMFNQVTGNTEENPQQNPQQNLQQNPQQNPEQNQEEEKKEGFFNFFGGRRRRRCKSMKMKGGRSNVGLSYYAAPVTDSVTAQPTYMMKSTGGRRKSCKRKTCRNRRSCRHLRRSRRH
jgi:hypothetical protein